MAQFLVLNGPNINLLGTREPDKYGRTTLAEIEAHLRSLADADGHAIDCFQSNAEHALVERVHAARGQGVGFAILNPAAFTHTSVALRDAFTGTELPFIEVHLSNIHRREPFRHHSYFSDVAVGVIAGLGAQGYELAYQAAVRHVTASGA